MNIGNADLYVIQDSCSIKVLIFLVRFPLKRNFKFYNNNNLYSMNISEVTNFGYLDLLEFLEQQDITKTFQIQRHALHVEEMA